MAKVKNLPSLEGEMLGKEMVRFYDQEVERQRALGLAIPERCNTCAFRGGSFPNRCGATAMDALKCSLEGVPFYCHEKPAKDAPERLCAGWFTMIRLTNGFVHAAWPFADDIRVCSDTDVAEAEAQ